MSWSSGYETGVEYTYGYYREMSPTLMRFALVLEGVRPPAFENMLELGAGRGLSLNIHTAANPMHGYAADFIPSHVVDANELAAGSGAQIFEDSFAETYERIRSGELPKFDAIAFHGVYSWVTAERRAELRQICNVGLKPGGVVYCSYNALPGWAGAIPLQRLFRMYAQDMAITSEPIEQRTKEGVALARKMIADEALYMLANPTAKSRIEGLGEHNFNYVVHEYQNEAWDCFFFIDVAREMARDAKLEYGASGHILELVPAINASAKARELLNEIESPLMREQMRDYWNNAGFRKDIFHRGAARLHPVEQQQLLQNTRIVPLGPKSAYKAKARAPFGEMTLNENIYPKVMDLLHAEGKPMRIGEIQKAMGFAFPVIKEVASILVGAGMCAPCNEESVVAKQKTKTRALNKLIRERAKLRGDLHFLASPVIGGGVVVNRTDQMFMTAIEAGAKTPQAWAQHASDAFGSVNQTLVRQGEPLHGDALLDDLLRSAKEFEEERLQTFKTLGLV